MTLPHVDYLSTAVSGFSEILERSDARTPVPSCPGWSIADLTEHLVHIHRWALSKIISTELSPLSTEMPLGDRFRLGAAELVAALSDLPADTPCWTLYPPETVGTWARRQALETTIHLWDAGNAVGTPVVIDSALAADGVREVVDDMYPRQVRLGRQAPLPVTVEFALSDTDARVRLAGLHAESVDAHVAGTASEVLLLVWGRRDLDAADVTVMGNPDAVRQTLAAALVP